VNPSHVVVEIVLPREAATGLGAFATHVSAWERPIAMAMKTVRFTFVAKDTSHGRELLLGAGHVFAAEWLEVGIDVFAVKAVSGMLRGRALIAPGLASCEIQHTHNCTSALLACECKDSQRPPRRSSDRDHLLSVLPCREHLCDSDPRRPLLADSLSLH
jgi:hypothetical protein